METFRALSG